MTSEQKLENVRAQMKAVEEGRTNVITCPYCDARLMKGDMLCCETFIKAAMAIVERQGVQEQIDNAARIADKVSLN